jgi:hypothetical protein
LSRCGERVLRVTELRETDSDGKAEKLVSLQKGKDGKSYQMAGFGDFEDGSRNKGIIHRASPHLEWRRYYTDAEWR